MVEPFYAVKCNPDLAIVRLLATLGCGFDCASMSEIDLVLNKLGNQLNISPQSLAGDKLVYA
jgi:ornithine decarboxylase